METVDPLAKVSILDPSKKQSFARAVQPGSTLLPPSASLHRWNEHRKSNPFCDAYFETPASLAIGFLLSSTHPPSPKSSTTFCPRQVQPGQGQRQQEQRRLPPHH